MRDYLNKKFNFPNKITNNKLILIGSHIVDQNQTSAEFECFFCIEISQNEFKILKHSEDETKTRREILLGKEDQISLSHLPCGMAEKQWWRSHPELR